MAEKTTLFLDTLDTAIGRLVLVADAGGALHIADWSDDAAEASRLLGRRFGAAGFTLAAAADPGGVTRRLAAYFSGAPEAIDDIAVSTGGTEFQRGIWTALRGIRAGETRSYGAFAAMIGRPTAVRAVGHANGANPVAVVVPCHRLVGSDGALTGYGGGIERKRWLLCHEGAIA
jgi:methylated-DNA-[protein]-cysteine S-methyltransferase